MTSPEMGMGIPNSPEQEKRQMFMSEKWTPEERSALAEIMKRKIDELKAEEAKLRETILYEAPCFKEIKNKIEGVEDLADKIRDEVPTEFLEKNRFNFQEFIF